MHKHSTTFSPIQDLSPYLPTMVPGLKESLLNPMPDVRSASARAFGTMVKSMGEQGVGDLLPWLFDTLTSESSTVDRAGAAQGLIVQCDLLMYIQYILNMIRVLYNITKRHTVFQ